MMAVLYTTTDQIRGVLGITPQDFTDSQITNAQVAEQLLDDLEEWLPTHETIQTEGENQAATDEQKKLWRRLQLYTMFRAAYLCLDPLELAVPQQVSDGQMEMQRFSDVDRMVRLRDQLDSKAGRYQALLAADLDLDLGSSHSPVGLSSRGTDPVTGG